MSCKDPFQSCAVGVDLKQVTYLTVNNCTEEKKRKKAVIGTAGFNYQTQQMFRFSF